MAETYYDVLGLSRKPSKDDLLLGYMQLACKWHPENHHNSADAAEKFRQIGEAFCILYDAKARFGYDKSLAVSPDNESARRIAMPLEKTLAVFEEMTVRYVESEMQSGLNEIESVSALTAAGCPLAVAQRVTQKVYATESIEIQTSGYVVLAAGAAFFGVGAAIPIITSSESNGKSYWIWYWPLIVGLVLIIYSLYCIRTGRRALSLSALFRGDDDTADGGRHWRKAKSKPSPAYPRRNENNKSK